MSNPSLKSLFSEYTNGLISQEEYRYRRTQLIDEMTGEITVRNDDFSPPTNPSYQAPHDTSKSDDSTTAKPSHKAPIIIFISIAILLIAGVSVQMMYSTSKVGNKSGTTSTNDRSDIQSNNPNHEAKQIALNLLEQEQWSSSEINSFIKDWKQLTLEERTAASTSSWYRDLNDMIARRILEQRALADIGDAKAVKLEKQLQELSDTLNADNQ